jgi:hypothetical protein
MFGWINNQQQHISTKKEVNERDEGVASEQNPRFSIVCCCAKSVRNEQNPSKSRSGYNALRACSQGFNQSQDENRVKPHQTPINLL